MSNPKADAQLFLYDLANLAKEHWFKPDERWSLSLANEVEKIAIEKKYFPTLHIQGETEDLEKIFVLMRPELRMAEPAVEMPDERRAKRLPAIYLIAFNIGRERK